APASNPAQPLAHEWYSAIICFAPIGGAFLGSLLGLVVGIFWLEGRKGWITVGLLLGMSSGLLLAYLLMPPDPRVPAEESFRSAVALSLLGSLVGLLFGVAAGRHFDRW